MSRLARRRDPDPLVLPRRHRTLPIEAIWRWAGTPLSLMAAVGLTLWLEHLSVWSGLRSSIESLDFDPSRAALILGAEVD